MRNMLMKNQPLTTMSDIVEKEKHLILRDKKPDDDCMCEVCKNAELLLDAAKTYLKKNEKNEIAKALPATTTEILESSVCSVKNQEHVW